VSSGLSKAHVFNERHPQPMHVVSRPRIASSVAMRSSSSRQRVERGADALQRDARRLARLDERHAAQRHTGIAALIAVCPPRRDQSLALVEPERGLRDAAADRKLADGEFARHLT
jgi:hypothetical protein